MEEFQNIEVIYDVLPSNKIEKKGTIINISGLRRTME